MVSDLISKANEFLINSSHNIIDNEYKFELINEKHSSSIIEWRNDISNYSLMTNQTKLNNKLQQQFLEKYNMLDRLDFILIHISSKKHLGSFSLTGISTNMPKIGKLLGDKNYRGKGLGYKSTKLLLFFAFNYLKFNNLYAKTRKDNTSNINLNKKLGFQIIKEEEINGKQFIIMKLENFTEI